MINRVVLMGRICSDLELKHTTTGKAVTTFRLAVPRNYDKEKTDFIDIVAWEHNAEFICKTFTKGNLIAVEGSLMTRQYQTKDGSNRTVVEVRADNISFTGERIE